MMLILIKMMIMTNFVVWLIYKSMPALFPSGITARGYLPKLLHTKF